MTHEQLKALVALYYERHAAGGPLHIVLDDGNMEDGHIAFCRAEALKIGDHVGDLICDELMEYSFRERESLYESQYTSTNIPSTQTEREAEEDDRHLDDDPRDAEDRA